MSENRQGASEEVGVLKGIISQLAETLGGSGKKCQGMASAVPPVPQKKPGL